MVLSAALDRFHRTQVVMRLLSFAGLGIGTRFALEMILIGTGLAGKNTHQSRVWVYSNLIPPVCPCGRVLR